MNIGKYAVVQLVPDLVRDERVNVGVILLSPSDRRADAKYDFSRVRALAPGLDISPYQRWFHGLRDQLRQRRLFDDPAYPTRWLETMAQQHNLHLRLTDIGGTTFESFERETQSLFEAFVSKREEATRSRATSVKVIKSPFVEKVKATEWLGPRVQLDARVPYILGECSIDVAVDDGRLVVLMESLAAKDATERLLRFMEEARYMSGVRMAQVFMLLVPPSQSAGDVSSALSAFGQVEFAKDRFEAEHAYEESFLQLIGQRA